MSYCRKHSWIGTGHCPDCADPLRARLATEAEYRQLLADHSVALQFVREIAQPLSAHAAPDCTCIVCRARAWLHTETK